MAVIPMDGAQYEEMVNSGRVFLVAFWTDWSEDYKELLDVLEPLAEEYQGRVVVGSINADQEGFLAMELGVAVLPTIIIYKGGIEMDRVAGCNSTALYSRMLQVRLTPDEPDDVPPGYI